MRLESTPKLVAIATVYTDSTALSPACTPCASLPKLLNCIVTFLASRGGSVALTGADVVGGRDVGLGAEVGFRVVGDSVEASAVVGRCVDGGRVCDRVVAWRVLGRR